MVIKQPAPAISWILSFQFPGEAGIYSVEYEDYEMALSELQRRMEEGQEAALQVKLTIIAPLSAYQGKYGGQVAYETYSLLRRGIAVNGDKIPYWSDLKPEIYVAWSLGVAAAIDWWETVGRFLPYEERVIYTPKDMMPK